MKVNVVYIRDTEGRERAVSVTLFHNGRPYVASDSHPNFTAILDAIEQQRPSDEIADMFDISSAIARGFKNARRLLKSVLRSTQETHDISAQVIDLAEPPAEPETELEPRIEAVAVVPTPTLPSPVQEDLEQLGQRELQQLARQHGISSVVGKKNSELRALIRSAQKTHLIDVADKVTFDGRGNVHFDGEPVHGAIADTIVAYYRHGNTNFLPLLRFLAKLMENPSPHSREHLYEWLGHLSFNIAEDGDIIAYKGVRRDSTHGYTSQWASGTAKVNGTWYRHEAIPNPIGGIVEMERHEVTFDPNVGCSRGLHVGTVGYAMDYGNVLLEVKVNPRDVVSVPNEHLHQKLRVCRYQVVRECTTAEARTLSAQPTLAGIA